MAVTVVARPNEDPMRLYRRWKRRVDQEQVVQEARDRQEFTPPSMRRHRKDLVRLAKIHEANRERQQR